MKKIYRFFLLLIGFVWIVPAVILLFFQKDVQLLIKGEENIEWYLPGMLYEVVDDSMHMEMLKAQAVLLRSNTIKNLQDGEVTYKELQKKYNVENKEFYNRLVDICEMTKGEVVMYENEICYCPFFYSSNGTTREAFSFFKDGSYPYLIAVPSHRDEESSSYITYHHFTMDEFQRKMGELSQNTFQNQIEILERDDSDYITWIKVGEEILGGEIFRKSLNLASACFSVEQKNQGIRIACKGKGHGFGFSQYGANAMALDGKEYKELIQYYFRNITIENMYRFS